VIIHDLKFTSWIYREQTPHFLNTRIAAQPVSSVVELDFSAFAVEDFIEQGHTAYLALRRRGEHRGEA